MTLDTFERLRRLLLLAAIPLGALTVVPGAFDAIALPKLAVAWFLAAALVAVGAVMALRTRAGVSYGLDLPSVAVLAFLASAVLASLTADSLWTALMGRSGRAEGLLLYASGAAMFFAARAVFRTSEAGTGLLRATVWTGVVLSGYAFLQGAGNDPWRFVSEYSPYLGTMGNPNFLSGYLACVVPAAAALALHPKSTMRWRVCSAAAAVMALAVAYLTGSQQGPIAAVAGVGLMALVRYPPKLRLRTMLLIAVAVMGALGIGLAAFDPLARLVLGGGLETRVWYWTAAVQMFLDHPVLGVGMAGYGDYFRAYRPMAATIAQLRAVAVADAPHSVPLGMFAQGGALLGMSYLAVLGATGWAVVRTWWSRPGQRAVMAGIAGAWFAYVVQSLVSFDLPSHVVLHWIFAGALVGTTDFPAVWCPSVGRGGRRTRNHKNGGVPGGLMAAAFAVVLLAVASLVQPLRANVAAGRAMHEAIAGRGRLALAAWNEAVAAAPWDATYWAERGRLLVKADQLAEAYDSYREAARRNPRHVPALVTAARLAVALDREHEAAGYYDQALEVDPTGPEVLVDAAQFYLDHGDPRLAHELAEHVIRLVQDRVEWWFVLARARAAVGDPEGAQRALDETQSRFPQDPRLDGLRKELTSG